MNSLWHYGDSFSTCGDFETIFSSYIAKHYNLSFKHRGVGGTGNFEIFSELIKHDRQYLSGDMILINWSFFNRITLTEMNGDLIGIDNLLIHWPEKIITNKIDEKGKNLLIDYINDWNFMEQIKLFKYIVRPYFSGLEKRGVKIKMVFLEQYFPNNINKTLYYNKIPIVDSIITNLFKSNVLEFKNHYSHFLVNKDWMKHESVHYARGIQPLLAEEYIKRIIETDVK